MPSNRSARCATLALCGLFAAFSMLAPSRADKPQPDQTQRIHVLFLGDRGPHKPAERIAQVLAPLAERGIHLTYTDELASLNPQRLKHYDAVLIYANHPKIEPAQEKALLEFVASGKGLVAVHCASFCFHNSPKYIELVGAQFKTHGAGIFKTRITQPDHPAMRGIGEIESWDETYVHDKHNKDRVVLEERVEGDHVEPWTWARTHGNGRVFYTAWGHDHRTWSNKGFVSLLAGGLRWSAGRENETWHAADEGFEYTDAKIPNYLSGEKWGTIGQAISKMQKPLSPEQSMKHIVVPPEFGVELYAAEPQVAKPVAMTWDERGRLWVAETVDYPNEMQPPGQGNDRIKICEDTDGDGVADKFTIFADKLSIPTSLVHAHGGLIVSQAPDMLFLKDTNGDDVADERSVLFTGFRTIDTHAGPSNLRYGFDNWIWATIGYSGFDGEVGGKHHRFGQGIFRFMGDGSAMEFIGSTSNNTWGLGFDETGEVFASTANNDHAVHSALPNRVYESVRGWFGNGTMAIADHKKFHPITSKVRQMDWHGGFTAAAGHGLYTARAFPRRYWNRVAFVTEPTGHLVHQNILEPVGSGYVARDGFNLFAGAEDEWVSPIMAETGPDGSVWVLDWYNFIIQHNPTPPGFQTGKGNAYVTPLRDKMHARIYRVVHRDGTHAMPKPLVVSDVDGLLAALGEDNLTRRLAAQRLLVTRGQRDVVPKLVRMLDDTQTDAIGSNPAALHALWTLDGLGVFDSAEPDALAAVRVAVSHPAAPVRKTAAQLIERHPATLAAAFSTRLITDSNPFVRRQSLVALSKLSDVADAGPLLLAAMIEPKNAKDRWIPDAAIAAAAHHHAAFITAALATEPSDSTGLGELVDRATRTVTAHYAQHDAGDSVLQVLEALPKSQPSLAASLLDGLLQGWADQPAPRIAAEQAARLAAAFEGMDDSIQARLILLMSRWGHPQAVAEMRGRVVAHLQSELSDASLPTADRSAAGRWFVRLTGQVRPILAQVNAQTSPDLAQGLLDSLVESPDDATAAVLLDETWNTLTPSSRRAAVAVLLRRPAWTLALLHHVKDGKLLQGDIPIEYWPQLTQHNNKSIAALARELRAATTSTDMQKLVSGFAPILKMKGDAARGKELYALNCAVCHQFAGVGGRIGPALDGIGARPREEIIVAILDPNRSVEANFRLWIVSTTDGRVISGRLETESQTTISLLDLTGTPHVVQRKDIQSLQAAPVSLMPIGFERLEHQGMADLLEYLSYHE